MSEQASSSEAGGLSLDADWNAFFIDGEWRRAPERDRIDVTDPSTGEVLTQIPSATEEDVDEAFAVAKAAQEDWREVTPDERSRVVREAANVIDDHEAEIREILAREGGSTKSKQDIEWGGTVSFVHDAASYPFRMGGKHAESKIPGKENIILRKPVGVVSVISPWNVPLKLAIRAVAPAIATGNSVVLKPPTETPVAGGLLIGRVFEKAGLPDGVLNVVTGHGSVVGDRVASHPDNEATAFTGSTGAGRIVGKNTVDHFAFPALELGGNNPHVVLEDADLDAAVDAGVFGTFWNQGQVCISINRHLVHESLYDEYVERLAERAKALKVGNPHGDDDVVVGPIINEEQRDSIVRYIEETVEQGGEILAGGEYEGQFVEPTVIANCTNDMSAACNEHFGPVAPIVPFESDEEAIELANDTEYGLAGSVHSADLGHARDVADEIDVGMMHVNDQTVNVEPHMPFGGVKASGIGRYNGEWIIDEFTEVKWTSVQRQPRGYPF